MSAARTRNRKNTFFIAIAVVLTTLGFIIIITNSQQQVEELRQTEFRCEQQQDALSNQLKVLEKTIKLEREENLKAINDKNEQQEKQSIEANSKYSSLQQKYTLLQNQHDELNEEYSKLKSKQEDEITHLNAELQLIRNQLKDTEQLRKDLERVQADYDNNVKLLNEYKANCDKYKPANQKDKYAYQVGSIGGKSFSRMVGIGDGLYAAVLNTATNVTDVNLYNPINNMDEFQMDQNDKNENQHEVLGIPPVAGDMKSSTPTNKKTSENRGDLLNAVTPIVSSMVSSSTANKAKLPRGVVPAPDTIIDNNKDTANQIEDKIENQALVAPPAKQEEKLLLGRDSFGNEQDQDNKAQEDMHDNDFMVEDEFNKDQQKALDSEEQMNNAQELGKDGFNDKVNKQRFDGEERHDKLMKEIAGDQGKIPEYNDDHEEFAHAEQADEDDEDEYSNLKAQKQDPVVRN